jgi:hypothetical protein
MKQLMRVAAVVMGVVLLVATGESAGVFDKAEYAARRARLMEKIGDGAAVFLGAPTPASDRRGDRGADDEGRGSATPQEKRSVSVNRPGA